MGLDPVAVPEEHLAIGWEYYAEVLVEAPAEDAVRWLPRTLGRLEPLHTERCRLVGSTSNPWWYAEQLAALPASYRIVGGPELRATARTVGQRMLAAAGGPDADGMPDASARGTHPLLAGLTPIPTSN